GAGGGRADHRRAGGPVLRRPGLPRPRSRRARLELQHGSRRVRLGRHAREDGPEARHRAAGGRVMSEAPVRPSVVPLIWYDRPRAAIDWLQTALGFEATMNVYGDEESVIHSELVLGNGSIYVVGPASMGQGGATPAQAGGRNTQSVCVNLTEGIDAHCERARAAGAKIQREPADQPYGDRVYTC